MPTRAHFMDRRGGPRMTTSCCPFFCFDMPHMLQFKRPPKKNRYARFRCHFSQMLPIQVFLRAHEATAPTTTACAQYSQCTRITSLQSFILLLLQDSYRLIHKTFL